MMWSGEKNHEGSWYIMGIRFSDDAITRANESGSLINQGKIFNNGGTPKYIIFFPSKMLA